MKNKTKKITKKNKHLDIVISACELGWVHILEDKTRKDNKQK